MVPLGRRGSVLIQAVYLTGREGGEPMGLFAAAWERTSAPVKSCLPALLRRLGIPLIDGWTKPLVGDGGGYIKFFYTACYRAAGMAWGERLNS